ncbi:MAG: proline racemase family protein, partial [Gammaproteobacteria bacterium]|nr:proline racemase family protein [Gammaproteobacteria bacterium]
SATVKSAVVVRPGKIDRSPTGTGLSALLAVLRAKGALALGASLTGRSIIGSEFTARIEEELRLGGKSAIRASVTGRGWITGRRQLLLDPGDPWPTGYRLSDTWPDIGPETVPAIRGTGRRDNI